MELNTPHVGQTGESVVAKELRVEQDGPIHPIISGGPAPRCFSGPQMEHLLNGECGVSIASQMISLLAWRQLWRTEAAHDHRLAASSRAFLVNERQDT